MDIFSNDIMKFELVPQSCHWRKTYALMQNYECETICQPAPGSHNRINTSAHELYLTVPEC